MNGAAKALELRDGPGRARVLAAVLLLTCPAAAFLAVVPTKIGIAIVAGLLAVTCLALPVLLTPTLRARVSQHFFVFAPIALLMISMVRVSVRDPINGGGGLQQVFELMFQVLAAGLVVLALLMGRYEIKLRGASILWLLFALMAGGSALWSDHPSFTLLKGIQLLVVVGVLSVVAPNLPTKEGSARFLGYFGAILFVALLVGELAMGGVSAAWRPYEAQSLEFVGGRFRLSLLAIHPLTLGDVAGTLALLVFVNRRRAADWIPIGLLLGIVVLSFARAALILLVACMFAAYVLQVIPRARRRSSAVMMLSSLTAMVVAAFVIALNTADPGQLKLPGLNAADATSLNGRTPLWHDIWLNFVQATHHFSGALLGHGFGSFRYFGLLLFNYAGEAHSSPLQVLFELGLVGLGLWIAAVVASIVNATRRGAPLHENLSRLMPIIFLIMLELMDSALADSRSFELVMLLAYTLPLVATEAAPIAARAAVPRPASVITGGAWSYTAMQQERSGHAQSRAIYDKLGRRTST